MRITLQQLHLFVTLAEYEHMGQASAKLFISQSAVSMGLASLEQQLGQRLFDRIGKRLLLNSNGKALLPQAKDILLRVNALAQLFIKDSEYLSDELVIGASQTIGSYLLPRLVSEFIKTHPRIKIQLKVTNSKQVIADVLALKLDIGFVEGHCNDADLNITPWQHDEMLIIAAPKHPLAKKSRLSWQDFAKTKWILREAGSGARDIFMEAVSDKFVPDILLELGNNEAIKQAVLTGAGMGCLSRLAVQNELKSKKLITLPLPKRTISRELLMLTHKARFESPALQVLKNMLSI